MFKWRGHGKTRENRYKNIRLLPCGTVERKYLRKGNPVWKIVDCYTLSPSKEPRSCPEGYRARLLATAI